MLLLLVVVVGRLVVLEAVLLLAVLVVVVAALVLLLVVVAAAVVLVVALVVVVRLLGAPVAARVVLLRVALLVVAVAPPALLLVQRDLAELLLALRDHPVELEGAERRLEAREEEVLQMGVVGLLVELELAAVGKIRLELLGVALAERLDRGAHLLLLYFLVLLVLLAHMQALPG